MDEVKIFESRIKMKHPGRILTGLLMAALVVAFAVTDGTGKNGEQKGKASESSKFNYRNVKNNAFDYGERLDYDVTYSFIKAGTGFFHVLPKPQYRGLNKERECMDIRFQVNSLQSLEWIYKVKDSYRTVLDAKGIFPWEFEQHVREGGYSKDYKAYFDQINNYAYAEDKKVKVDPYMHDIVSAFYYVRTLDLGSMSKGQVFKLKNYFDDKSYDLGVKIIGKQTVEVPAGKFRCVIIEPLVTEGGLFKSEGQIYVWLTDDENKIPVKVSTKILIGYVSAELTKYSGLKNAATAKVD